MNNRRIHHLFPLLLIILVGILAYANGLAGPFQFDDYSSIVENPVIRALDLSRLWQATSVRAVGYLTFALNYRAGGLSVVGYHATNVAVHLMASCILFLFAQAILRRAADIDASPLSAAAGDAAALTAALLFVAHPVETQAVTYIVQRLASLAALFYLLSLLLYVHGRVRMIMGRPGGWRWLALALVTAVIAMFTKQTAFTLPAAIVLVEYFFFLPSLAFVKRRIALLVAALALMLVIPAAYLASGAVNWGDLSELARETDLVSRKEYFFTEINVVRTYLRLLVLPFRQHLDYVYPISTGFFTLHTMLSALIHLSLIAAAIATFRRLRPVSFGILFFYLALAVESGPFPIRDVLVEHRLYLPSAGFFIACSTVFWALAARRQLSRRIAWGIVMAVVIALGVLTHLRNEVWQTAEGPWEEVIRLEPMSWRAYYSVGKQYEKQRRFDKALVMYRKALDIHESPWPWNNMGNILLIQGKTREGIAAYRQAIVRGYEFAPAHANLSVALEKTGDIDAAKEENRIALTLDPRFAPACYNLGRIHMALGKLDAAETWLRRALEIDPTHVLSHYRLGLVLFRKGDREGALGELKRAQAIDPANARVRSAIESIGRGDAPISRQ